MEETLSRLRAPWIWIVATLVVSMVTAAVVTDNMELPFLVVGAVLAGAAGIFTLGYLLTHPFACLLAYCFFVPLEALFVAPVVGSIPRFLGILFVISYGAANWRNVALNVLPKQAWLWYYWAASSFLWALDQSAAMDALVIVSLQFMIVFLMADLVGRFPHRLTAVLWASTGGALVTAFLGLRNFLSGLYWAPSEAGDVSIGRVTALAGEDPAFFAGGMVLGLLFLIYILTQSRHRWPVRLAAGLLCLPLVAATLGSGSRGMWSG